MGLTVVTLLESRSLLCVFGSRWSKVSHLSPKKCFKMLCNTLPKHFALRHVLGITSLSQAPIRTEARMALAGF